MNERYGVVKSVGQGTYGRALLCKSYEDGLLYVVKEIPFSSLSKKDRQNAKRECRVLSQLSHPNIVVYRESWIEQGALLIAMEFAEGGDLGMKISRRKGVLFTEQNILNWFLQLCLAVDYIHQRHILHRDIKSANVFVTSKNSIKLGDFGVARPLGSVEMAKSAVGTPYYLSPEMAAGKPYDSKSDVWAMGVLLHELMALKMPFEAASITALARRIQREDPDPPPRYYSRDARKLISLCLRKDHTQRPTVAVLLQAPILKRRMKGFLAEATTHKEFANGRARAQRNGNLPELQSVHSKYCGHCGAALAGAFCGSCGAPSAGRVVYNPEETRDKSVDPRDAYKQGPSPGAAGDAKARPRSVPVLGERTPTASGDRPNSAIVAGALPPIGRVNTPPPLREPATPIRSSTPKSRKKRKEWDLSPAILRLAEHDVEADDAVLSDEGHDGARDAPRTCAGAGDAAPTMGGPSVSDSASVELEDSLMSADELEFLDEIARDARDIETQLRSSDAAADLRDSADFVRMIALLSEHATKSQLSTPEGAPALSGPGDAPALSTPEDAPALSTPEDAPAHLA